MQGGNVKGVKFYMRYNFLQKFSTAQVDKSIETIALMLTATANKETEQQTAVCTHTKKIQTESEAIDCSLVVSSAQIRLTVNFQWRGKCVFQSVFVLVSCHCDIHTQHKVRGEEDALCLCLVSNHTISPPTYHQRKGATVIPTRLMNGDTLIFVIPNWCCRFN